MTSPRRSYVLALLLAGATVLFLVLAVGALGIVGDGGRADRIFVAVPAVLLLGALLTRLRPRGMSWALLATATTQVALGVGAVVAVLADAEDYAGASVVDVLGITAMYAVLFTISAWLFRRAAERVPG